MTRPAHSFAVGERDFLLDGEPFRILSGGLHYFRVHPAQWADRIRKARQMGLNTIETYVAWNAHAPVPGSFSLAGGLDLGRFLDLVAAEGMFAIVRPGPYICAEWTGGGLPAWLRSSGVTAVRSADPAFLTAVRSYFAALAPVLVPRQADRGGPVILVQVENEYGAYGSDKSYLAALTGMLRDSGITVPLYTVDQPADGMPGRGSLPGVLVSGSFGSRITERLAVLRSAQPSGPLLCGEFWCGWFDDWGGHHHVVPASSAAASLDELLAAGASVSIYMFHGGTNFGLTSGANDKGTFQAITTSYDYDAPLDEAGRPTEKYWAFRDVIAKYAPVPPLERRPARGGGGARGAEFSVPLAESVPLWDVLDLLGGPSSHDMPPAACDIGQYQGFTLYATDLDPAAPDQPAVLSVGEVRDRAQVFLGGQPVGVLARDHHDTALVLPARPAGGGRLEILVEDQGQVNYGPRIGEPKGLIGPVTLDGAELRGWEARPLPLDSVDDVAKALRAAGKPVSAGAGLAGPRFARAEFDLPAVDGADEREADLFLSTAGWGKGIAWLNGFCLGRYWSRGPQRTLYVPGPVTRERANELIILELHAARATASFAAAPDLGHTED